MKGIIALILFMTLIVSSLSKVCKVRTDYANYCRSIGREVSCFLKDNTCICGCAANV